MSESMYDVFKNDVVRGNSFITLAKISLSLSIFVASSGLCYMLKFLSGIGSLTFAD